ncbi:MAG TPA: metalloprotease TldD, partial [Gammaproteobacteria bacterium]|nr:metalloprotease TldD [Gammaproteobacteria bacterium]
MIEQVSGELLIPRGLDQSYVEGILSQVMGHQVDYAEVFVQSVRAESFGLEDSIVKDGSFSLDAGVGVRALAGEKTGFAYCEDILPEGITQAASAA